jgi:hypothetical protein
MAGVAGLAPYLPPHRPRARARWWSARGRVEGESLLVGILEERDGPPAVEVPTGLVAPCSLPRAFLEYLGIPRPREEVLRRLAERTPGRLLADARAFASRTPRGHRQPLRVEGESASALDRRRLALFAASLELLRATPTVPWAEPARGFLFEVDATALVEALGLPASGRSGDRPEAVRMRAAVLAALAGGALGLEVRVEARDLAVASRPALDAVLAAALAAWLVRTSPPPPPPDAEAWIPLPGRP